jgi:malonyl-CoA O-methyltransferase
VDSGADARRVRRNLARHASRHADRAQLSLEIGGRLLDHLDGLRIEPARVLLLGSGPGMLRELLETRFPQAAILYADAVPQLLAQMPRGSRLRRLLGTRAPQRLACSAAALPLRNGSIDLVIAHGVLAWEPPDRVFAEARRVLAPDGLLLFSTLGPDTLMQWRVALAAARPGVDPLGHSVLRFPDMHDLADLASGAGLASPVVDMEYLTVHYPEAQVLLDDLRVLGGGNGLRERLRGLMTPRARRRLLESLEAERTAQGLPQTLELIYGHAWNANPLVSAGGRPVIPIHAAPT